MRNIALIAALAFSGSALAGGLPDEMTKDQQNDMVKFIIGVGAAAACGKDLDTTKFPAFFATMKGINFTVEQAAGMAGMGINAAKRFAGSPLACGIANGYFGPQGTLIAGALKP